MVAHMRVFDWLFADPSSFWKGAPHTELNSTTNYTLHFNPATMSFLRYFSLQYRRLRVIYYEQYWHHSLFRNLTLSCVNIGQSWRGEKLTRQQV